MKYLIAGFAVEMAPKYERFTRLCAPFAYDGEREADFSVVLTKKYFDNTFSRMAEGISRGEAEEFCFASLFYRKVINYGAMLLHSSALVCGGRAYMFSADSGVGKTTHTNLWLKAFGSKVHILNGDKPAVRQIDGRLMCCGTPFDGGSGVALNEAVPIGAVVFVERSDRNYVTVPKTSEIVTKLYTATVKMVDEKTALKMLENFDRLVSGCKFYTLHCNMDISAAYTAYEALCEGEHMDILKQ